MKTATMEEQVVSIGTCERAKEIVGGLARPGKMPCVGYSLPAGACRRGAKLSTIAGSVCFGCYAADNRDWLLQAHTYNNYCMPNVRTALARRLAALADPMWVPAMVLLAGRHKYFRWHDSGDLQSVAHLRDIVTVAENTPDTKHWLPTREYGFVNAYRRQYGDLRANLTVRLSADWIDAPARVPVALADLPTSTVETSPAEHWRTGRRRPILTCRANRRDGKCDACRACWVSAIDISYPLH